MTKNYRQSHHFWKIMRHASKTPPFKEGTVSEIWKCLEQSDNKHVWYICCVSAAHAKRNCLASSSSIRNKHWTLIVDEWLEKIRIKIVEENPEEDALLVYFTTSLNCPRGGSGTWTWRGNTRVEVLRGSRWVDDSAGNGPGSWHRWTLTFALHEKGQNLGNYL